MITIYTFNEFCSHLKQEGNKIIFQEISPVIEIKELKKESKEITYYKKQFKFTDENFASSVEMKIINNNSEITKERLYRYYLDFVIKYLIRN